MRICFTSDWQLGAGTDLGTGDHGPGSRLQDQIDVLNRMVDLAIEEKVGLFAMLGDAFERSRPNPSEILAVQNVVRRLLENGIRSLFILGNHDSRGSALPSALEIFATSGCVVALAPSFYPLDDPGGNVVIAALPWTPPGAIVAAMPDVARDDINDAAAQALVAGARALREQCELVCPEHTPILVGHWMISGTHLPGGLDTSLLRVPVIPLESLTASGFALAMFGDVHAPQMLASGPCPVGYCGSPYVNSWGETEGDHGVWIYESAGSGDLRFYPILDNKRFLTLKPTLVEIAGNMAFAEPPEDVRGAVLRVQYEVTEAQARKLDQRKMRDDLLALGALKVIFRPTLVREERARVAGLASEGVDETRALDLWIESQQIDNGLAAQMHDAHASYLARVKS